MGPYSRLDQSLALGLPYGRENAREKETWLDLLQDDASANLRVSVASMAANRTSIIGRDAAVSHLMYNPRAQFL